MGADLVDLVRRLEDSWGTVWTDEQLVDPAEAGEYAALHGYADGNDSWHPVPPGYGAALTMRAVLRVLHDDVIALPFDRNVHAAQSLEWAAAMQLGARLITTAQVQNVRLRERAVFFDVRTESVDDAGRTCLRGIATQAVRHG